MAEWGTKQETPNDLLILRLPRAPFPTIRCRQRDVPIELRRSDTTSSAPMFRVPGRWCMRRPATRNRAAVVKFQRRGEIIH